MFDELKPLHDVQMTILQEFNRVCKKHNLQYFLAWGTLLGAIRDGHIIPWDDDIDVVMPLDDYNKLEYVYRNEFADGYFLQSYESEPESGLTFKKLRKNDTTLFEVAMKNKNVHQGISIDIYPFYHLADHWLARQFQYVSTILWMLYTVGRPPVNHGGVMSFAAKSILCITPDSMKGRLRNVLYRRFTKYQDRKTQCIYFGHDFSNLKKRYRSEWYHNSVMVKLEDGEFPASHCAHEILSQMYGDYMQPPPPERRGTKMKENIIAWSTEIPYTKFTTEKEKKK